MNQQWFDGLELGKKQTIIYTNDNDIDLLVLHHQFKKNELIDAC